MGRQGSLVGMIGPLMVAALVTLLAVVVQGATSGAINDIIILFGINAILVVGFQSFAGNTGIMSFGHVAFMAVGAYTAGILAIPVTLKPIVLPSLPGFLSHVELSTFWTLLVAGLVASAVALVAGFAIMRLSGTGASIATLGMLVIVNNVLSQAHAITRGPQSFFGVPQDASFGWVFGSLIVVVALSAWMKWSGIGLRSRAVRDDMMAAEASGAKRVASRLWPFVLSGFITGVGGGLYAKDLTAFSPDSFFISQVVGVLVMAIIGGLSSISGALVGATVISVLVEILRNLEAGIPVGSLVVQAPAGISQAVLGVVLILMLRWRPAGITGPLELEIDPRRWRVPGGRSRIQLGSTPPPRSGPK